MIKLNLGSGHDYREGYINIDFRKEITHPRTGETCRSPDIVADITQNEGMLYPENFVDEILASDILEHFVAPQGLILLNAWKRTLRPGGRLTVQVPDIDECIERAKTGEWSWSYAIQRIFGGQDYKGNFHLWGFTNTTLQETLKEIGFEILSSHYINGNVVVEARKQ